MSELVERLCRARLDGHIVTVQDGELGDTLDAAYTLQKQVLQRIGDPSDSWKIGSTSAEAQAALGTSEPGAARIPKRFCYSSPANVPIFAAHNVMLEGEFAFRLGADLPPRDTEYTYAEVAKAVASIAPSLEIVGSRLSGGLLGAGRLATTADGSANIALVTGEFTADWQRFDLPSHQLSVSINGTVRATGEGRRALGNPMNVMVWLANWQRTREGLRAGETATTGTCSGILDLNVGDTVLADYGDLGSIEATFIDAAKS